LGVLGTPLNRSVTHAYFSAQLSPIHWWNRIGPSVVRLKIGRKVTQPQSHQLLPRSSRQPSDCRGFVRYVRVHHWH
jgi:hypothetical protein